MPVHSPTLAAESRLMDLLMPLQYFYLQAERPLPRVEIAEGASLPEPERHLLVHQSDMTPRLRAFHQADITLQVIHIERSENYVMRLVVLHRQDTGRPVEFGAIGIQLDGFDPETREKIRQAELPLGTILEQREVPHTSAPKAYFRVNADEFMGNLLQEPVGTPLWGRCNALSHSGGIVFADIVEILPAHFPLEG